jgi:hypothetical protein
MQSTPEMVAAVTLLYHRSNAANLRDPNLDPDNRPQRNRLMKESFQDALDKVLDANEIYGEQRLTIAKEIKRELGRAGGRRTSQEKRQIRMFAR